MNNTCTPLTTNRDITGVGIRVSTYIQSFFLILSATMSEDTLKAPITATITSLSINISAFVQYNLSDGLSVVDQLVVIMLSLILALGIAAAPVPKKHLIAMTFLSVLTNTFQSAFALLVWTRKSVLQGNPGDCPAKYIIFGHSVSVTNNVLRGFSLFGYASAILGGFLSPLFSYVYSKFVQIIGDDSDSDSDDEDLDLSFFRTLVFAFSGLGSWIYLVITTETILLRNDVAMQSNTWSFGQTVATVLVLLPIIDFLSVPFISNFLKRLFSMTKVSTVARRPPISSSSKASSSSKESPIRREPPEGATPSVESPQEV